ncbi:hypothetical protein DIRU0_B02344 [Diutina rugosa]
MKLSKWVSAMLGVASAQVIFNPQNNAPSTDIIDLHRQLVEIESIAPNEAGVADYLYDLLKAKGYTVERQNISKGRYNIYAYTGKSRDAKVLVTSHIDTVPPYIPYSRQGSKIFGRGSADAKASVAAQIVAVDQLGLNEDVALLYVVGEEVDGVGMETANKLGCKWDVGIFGEPTELKLGVGHKGNYMFNLTAYGKASHSGYPELGRSAAEILIPVLNKLMQIEYPKSDLLGPSTLNVGKFEGGVAANVIPALASADCFIRVAADIEKIDKLVRSVVEGVDHLEFNLQATIPPVTLDYDVPGFDSIVLAYATDVPRLRVPLKKRVLYGPGSIHVAHGDNENVEESDLFDAVEGYKRLIAWGLKQ